MRIIPIIMLAISSFEDSISERIWSKGLMTDGMA